MIENQELYTKWLNECADAYRVSIEPSGRNPYEWKVTGLHSEYFGYVILRGAMINGTEVQKREELCRQLKKIVAKLR